MCFQVIVKYFAFSLEQTVKTTKSCKDNNLRMISSEHNSYTSGQKLAGPEAGVQPWSLKDLLSLIWELKPLLFSSGEQICVRRTRKPITEINNIGPEYH